MTQPTAADLAAACALARTEAAAGAAAGRLSGAVVAALRQARLFKLFLPAELGGLDLPLPEACRLISHVSEADGAAGWAVMIGTGPNWFAGQMAPGLAREVFGPADSAVAGSGSAGLGARVPGGLRVEGRWRWCSGAPWATWFTFNVAVPTGDMVTVALPADRVRLEGGSWDVTGLRATASLDVSVDGVMVPDSATFVVGAGPPQLPGPLFRVPFLSFAEATMAAVSVGVARRILAEFVELARSKRPTMADRLLGADPAVARDVARATAAANAAAAGLDAAVEQLWRLCADGDPPGEDAVIGLRLAACHAAAAAAEIGASLAGHAGMSVLASDSALARAVADAAAARQNAVLAGARLVDAGLALCAPVVASGDEAAGGRSDRAEAGGITAAV